ncbi:ER membrane protein complex subunit 5 isoform 2-T2 [Chlamydotis macqueenii]
MSGAAPLVTPSEGAGGGSGRPWRRRRGERRRWRRPRCGRGWWGSASSPWPTPPSRRPSVNRSYMRLTEKEDETLPIDIVLQTLLAFAVTCYGIVHIAGEFKDMDATSELKNNQERQMGVHEAARPPRAWQCKQEHRPQGSLAGAQAVRCHSLPGHFQRKGGEK